MKQSVIVYKDEVMRLDDKNKPYEDWTRAVIVAISKGMPPHSKYYSTPSPETDSIKFEWSD